MIDPVVKQLAEDVHDACGELEHLRMVLIELGANDYLNASYDRFKTAPAELRAEPYLSPDADPAENTTVGPS